jgi:hypothetical protein
VRLLAGLAPSQSGRHDAKNSDTEGIVRGVIRGVVLLGILFLVASTAEAQKSPRRDPSKITAEELKEQGGASLAEVVPRIRPNFFSFPGTTPAQQVITGLSPQIIVYVRTQAQGDTSVLRSFKANEFKEVRFFRPGDSRSPHMAGNAYVIQLLPKDRDRS